MDVVTDHEKVIGGRWCVGECGVENVLRVEDQGGWVVEVVLRVEIL
jgi:hypothetical protein